MFGTKELQVPMGCKLTIAVSPDAALHEGPGLLIKGQLPEGGVHILSRLLQRHGSTRLDPNIRAAHCPERLRMTFMVRLRTEGLCAKQPPFGAFPLLADILSGSLGKTTKKSPPNPSSKLMVPLLAMELAVLMDSFRDVG